MVSRRGSDAFYGVELSRHQVSVDEAGVISENRCRAYDGHGAHPHLGVSGRIAPRPSSAREVWSPRSPRGGRGQLNIKVGGFDLSPQISMAFSPARPLPPSIQRLL